MTLTRIALGFAAIPLLLVLGPCWRVGTLLRGVKR